MQGPDQQLAGSAARGRGNRVRFLPARAGGGRSSGSSRHCGTSGRCDQRGNSAPDFCGMAQVLGHETAVDEPGSVYLAPASTIWRFGRQQ
eukprot:5357749-Pyramimonas_sp.AAC.1